jgi:hypothetical protein
MVPYLAFHRSLLLAVMIGVPAIALAQTAAPPNASVYFINLKDGDTITSPFRIQFGLTGMGVAPAGLDWPNTGHHHLLIDTTLSPAELNAPIAMDAKHVHFGDGQTETMVTLPPGQHRLQLVLGDLSHIPFNPPVMSPVITVTVAMPVAPIGQVSSITIAPPELPVYEQPAIPAPGYIWSPGYWAYGPEGYFWVPGTWVLPPAVGLLWTPGYWGWRNGIYVWNTGYWGPHIGFYGGVNYGFGYGGVGYEGGYWNNGVFAYNRAVNNFGRVTIANVYNKTVIVDSGATRVAFNGGTGGTTAQPTPQEEAAAHEQHVAPTPAQTQHQQMASTNKALLASENHGQPAIAATTKPGAFAGKGVVAARQVTPGTTPAGTKPTGAAAVGEKSTGSLPQAVKPNPAPDLAKLPNPNSGGSPNSNHTAPGPSDKKIPPNDQAKLNGTGPPKTSNVGAKPLGVTPSAQTVKPNQPLRPAPAPLAAVKPPPPPTKPPAKPACPLGKTLTPAGCK